MEKLVRGWEELGVVDTIYEEEHEYYSTTPSLSPSLSMPPTPLHCRVEAWSLTTGAVTDAVIQVDDSRFCLHKGPLAERSGYLKRQLDESSEITLSPPLNITSDTFTLVADYCYGIHVLITPFNVVALRVAAELLEMTEGDGDAAEDSLGQMAEAYFRRAISLSREYALIGFRSCLPLLPEAETTAALASRCVEALSAFDDVDDAIMSCGEDVREVQPEDFQLLAESVKHRLTGSHDLLYKIVDIYLKEYDGKITEDQKAEICNSIDCTTLSPPLLMHAVQNPQMPLRFVVQAMFVDQLNTRRAIAVASTDHHRARRRRHRPPKPAPAPAGCPEAMYATSSRILSLERELDEMKKLLQQSMNQGSTPFLPPSSSFRGTTPDRNRWGTTPDRARSSSFRGTTPDRAQSSSFRGTTPDRAQSSSFRGTTPDRAPSSSFRGTTPDRAQSLSFRGKTPDRAQSSSFRGTTPDRAQSLSFRSSAPEVSRGSTPELAQSPSFRISAPELVQSSSFRGSGPELTRSLSFRGPELGRSLSFRGGTPETRIEKEGIGSFSASGFRLFPRETIRIATSSQASSEGVSPRSGKSSSRSLISRLKSALGIKKKPEITDPMGSIGSEEETGFGGKYGEGLYGNGNVAVMKKNMPFHHRYMGRIIWDSILSRN
ncbi:BTB/POZ domain-containing protein At3g49900 isoform X2 [Rhododendron vialii]|uniref:BTB/POZ domain-containing protein At3g49900 isoform X2 n=1 Tax=Rhododendron vialii TaxID=182163 RepID=UPI00265F73C1|nr:BTB/POZ domain-containing protein At3g49900 isoform X2 [Rhododendron vialii]